MKKIILIIAALVISLQARTITDQIGRKVEVPDHVTKVVVLMHQAIDILVQLNAQDKMVGVMDSWEKRLGSNFTGLFPGITKLPKVGNLRTANVEAIAKLHPDVVIVTSYMPRDVIESMSKLKIPVIALSLLKTNMKNSAAYEPVLDKTTADKQYLEGLEQGIEILADVTNTKPQGKKLIAFMEESRAILAKEMKKVKSKKLITAYIANPGLHTYGSGKYTSSFLAHIGAENVAEKAVHGYKQISLEQLYKWNPEYIIVQNRHHKLYEQILSDKLWAKLSAVKNKKVLFMPQYARVWGHPLPEVIALGELYVAKLFYPKALASFDINGRINKFYKEFYRTSYNPAWSK